MLPPLPSTNCRIHSLRPTAQISFLMASASGVVKRRRFDAEPGWSADVRDAVPFWAAGAGADPGIFAPSAAPPVTSSIPCCCRKSRAEGVTTQPAAVTIRVAPDASASCTSRIATSLRPPRSMLFSSFFNSAPQIKISQLHVEHCCYFTSTESTISVKYASTGTGVG